MSEEYKGGAMSEEYEEVRDRSNKLVMRLEAFESREVDEIDMKWLIGEVCHLRGAYITNSFLLRDERERAERAEEQRDRARAALKASCLWPACETTCSMLTRYRKCSILAALDDEPPEEKK